MLKRQDETHRAFPTLKKKPNQNKVGHFAHFFILGVFVEFQEK